MVTYVFCNLYEVKVKISLVGTGFVETGLVEITFMEEPLWYLLMR